MSTCRDGQVQITSHLPAALIYKCLPARGKWASINVERCTLNDTKHCEVIILKGLARILDKTIHNKFTR